MHQILLNKIPTMAVNQPNMKKVDFDKIRKIIHKAEQRKLDSVKQTFTFFKDIGQKDLQYFRGLRTELSQEMKKMNEDNIVYPEVVEDSDEEDFDDNESSLFDN